MATQRYHDELTQSLTGRAATLFVDAPAIVTEAHQLSFVELHRLVRRVAARLNKSGVGDGDVIGISCSDAVSTILSLLGVFDAGATAVPLPLRYPSESLARMCEMAGVSYLIADDESATTLAGVLPEFRPNTLTFAELCDTDRDESSPIMPAISNPERIVLAIFTSGSSGDPKAVALRYSNLIFSALGANRNVELGAADRWLLCLPLYHVGGISILIRCLLSGAAVAVPRLRADIAESALLFSATHLSVVPTQLRRLLNAGKLPGTLKAVLVGGGSTHSDLAADAVRSGVPLRLTYGLTEMSSQVATTSLSDDVNSCGGILPFRSVRLGNDSEILVRGETLFAGYIARGEVKDFSDTDGWFHTGDRGFFDDNCNLVVTGRIDDMFVSGGENIHPEEIELAVRNIVGIDRCVVISVQDEEFGARPVIFVTYSDKLITEAEILEGLRKVLPGFKVPIAVFDLPESSEPALSKVSRPQLSGIAYTLMREKGLIRR